jgi:REP element-mobilizing transposase RayT
MKKKNLDEIEDGMMYHVYNRAVGDELLFYRDEDYKYFLRLLEELVLPHANLLAYCLMPNHYHLLIEVKSGLNSLTHKILSNSFRKLGIRYVHSINQRIGRRGTLFMRPFKRIRIDNDYYLHQLITYIHLNPLSHHPINLPQLDKFPWNSYKEIINKNSKLVEIQRVIEIYDDLENFKYIHSLTVKKKLYFLSEEFEFRN